MYKSIQEFLNDWAKESESTIKILSVLTDASLNQLVSPGGRTLGFVAWHISTTIGEMMSKTGLDIPAPEEDSDAPSSAEFIKKTYEDSSDLMISEIKQKWTDEMLNDELDMYGQKWVRHNVLDGLIKHEIHHRGQMTVLMRQAGLKVPGVYGPSKEEWESYGMPTMK